MTDLVKLYNPANAASLTPEQIAGLQTLTVDQIKTLSIAYPNAAINKAYLLIIDKTKPVEKQLPNLSTFENLYKLITRNAQKNWVAYAFTQNSRPVTIKPTTTGRRTEVLDLTDKELMSLPGIKNITVGKDSGLPEKSKKAKTPKQ